MTTILAGAFGSGVWELLGLGPELPDELSGADDPRCLAGVEDEEVVVVGNDPSGTAGDCGGDELLVVGIFGDSRGPLGGPTSSSLVMSLAKRSR